MTTVKFVIAGALSCLLLSAAHAETYTPGQPISKDFKTFAKPFLANHCLDCHGDTDPEGDLSLHDLGPVDEVNAGVWVRVWSQVALNTTISTSPSCFSVWETKSSTPVSDVTSALAIKDLIPAASYSDKAD